MGIGYFLLGFWKRYVDLWGIVHGWVREKEEWRKFDDIFTYFILYWIKYCCFNNKQNFILREKLRNFIFSVSSISVVKFISLQIHLKFSLDVLNFEAHPIKIEVIEGSWWVSKFRTVEHLFLRTMSSQTIVTSIWITLNRLHYKQFDTSAMHHQSIVIIVRSETTKKRKSLRLTESVEQREIKNRETRAGWLLFRIKAENSKERRNWNLLLPLGFQSDPRIATSRAHLEDATIARENEIVLRNCETCRKSVAEWDETTIKMIRKYESKKTNPVEKLHFGNSFHFSFSSSFFRSIYRFAWIRIFWRWNKNLIQQEKFLKLTSYCPRFLSLSCLSHTLPINPFPSNSQILCVHIPKILYKIAIWFMI